MGSFFFFLLLLVLSEYPCPGPVLGFLVGAAGAPGEDVRFWEDFGLGLGGTHVRGDVSMVTTEGEGGMTVGKTKSQRLVHSVIQTSACAHKIHVTTAQ